MGTCGSNGTVFPLAVTPSGSGSLSSVAASQRLRRLDITYLLWCLSLVGVCGLQRFYNRRPLSGVLYLFTGGLCGLGQIVDLFLIPRLVDSANAPLLLEQARSEPIDRQLLQLARRSGAAGFTINDAILAIQPPGLASPDQLRSTIERLMHADLLDVCNDERGRVVYKEP